MTATQIKLELFRQIDVLPESIVVELKSVVQSFLQQRFKSVQLTDADINGAEIQSLIENNAAFDFLKDENEDIYCDADLKVKY